MRRQMRELCERYGLRDRLPRPIIEGDKRGRDKRVVEQIANQTYAMELAGENPHKIWAYRKAAWAIEDLEQDLGLIYKTMGVKGLQAIPNIGKSLAGIVEHLLSLTADPN